MFIEEYNIEIQNSVVVASLKRLTNQIYKLLPNREEGGDWQTPLTTIIEELAGMNKLLFDQQHISFSLLCKLKGLFDLTDEESFFLYRRMIFECLSLMNNLIKECQD
jgi:hypothetical protein